MDETNSKVHSIDKYSQRSCYPFCEDQAARYNSALSNNNKNIAMRYNNKTSLVNTYKTIVEYLPTDFRPCLIILKTA